MQGRKFTLDSLLPETKTVAFLIIRRDSLLYENYFHKYTDSSITTSFSMAKSYVSALMGIAIEKGKIGSVEDSMTHYLPELRGQGLEKVKLRHLLQMTSGIHCNEDYYNPVNGVAKMYYGKGLRKQMARLKLDHVPGHIFQYRSIDTQLLAMVVEKATGESLSSLLEKQIWQPLGMEYDGSWNIDQKKDGIEKAFCCINARARDFARFGSLYLHGGNWQGRQIIPATWVAQSLAVDASDGAANYYQYQWWIGAKHGDFYAQGHLGQFIYVHPEKEIVIVRLGKKYGGMDWPNTFRDLVKQL